jgi:hypothetical protein
MTQEKQSTRCNLVIEFIIPPFIESSTYFERAHRSSSGALTVFAASGLHTHVVTGRSQV